jgi:hypothetical protein
VKKYINIVLKFFSPWGVKAFIKIDLEEALQIGEEFTKGFTKNLNIL